jgi:hypothetical protein
VQVAYSRVTRDGVASGRVQRREFRARITAAPTTTITTPSVVIHIAADHVITITPRAQDAATADEAIRVTSTTDNGADETVTITPAGAAVVVEQALPAPQPTWTSRILARLPAVHARRRLQHGFGRAKQTLGAMGRVASARRKRLLLAGALVAVGLLAANATAYARQPVPPMIRDLSAQYRSLDWLYADSPDQLLGLDAPLWAHHVQPPPVSIASA